MPGRSKGGFPVWRSVFWRLDGVHPLAESFNLRASAAWVERHAARTSLRGVAAVGRGGLSSERWFFAPLRRRYGWGSPDMAGLWRRSRRRRAHRTRLPDHRKAGFRQGGFPPGAPDKGRRPARGVPRRGQEGAGGKGARAAKGAWVKPWGWRLAHRFLPLRRANAVQAASKLGGAWRCRSGGRSGCPPCCVRRP